MSEDPFFKAAQDRTVSDEAEACARLIESMADNLPQPTPAEMAAALRARHPAKVPAT